MSLVGVPTARNLVEAEVKGYPDNNPKTRFGALKTQYHYTPTEATRQLADVMKLGAEKYGAYNWRANSISASVYYDAMRRHIDQWFDGEDTDPESGRSHLAHVMACAALYLDAVKHGTVNDDRPK